MEGVFVVLIILIGIVISILVNNHFKLIPLPMIFIAVGIGLSFLPPFRNFTFDPNMFIFMIIAPLLYNEAQSASRYWIGRGAVNIFSLSIALVIVTVILVGFSVNTIFPMIPLALAFAMASVVTPTDASAVSAFAHPNPKYQVPFTILQNESLFNDAAGFVMFDLSLLMFVKGNFSIVEGAESFLLEFIGGLILGAIVGAVFHVLRSFLISLDDDSPIVMLVLELVVPFLVYFIAEEANLSGILAVVAAGLVQGVENDKLQLTASEVQLVRDNVWIILEEAMSGAIFMLLGLTLPSIIGKIIQTSSGLIVILVSVAAFIYMFKLLIRVLWTRYLVWMHLDSGNRWKDSLLMGVSGASGTISLSLAFLFPESVNQNALTNRDTLIFIVAVIILISLTVAAIMVPKMTKDETKRKDKSFAQWNREMIMVTMNELRKQPENHTEAQIVVDVLSQQLHQHAVTNIRKLKSLYKAAHATEVDAITKLHEENKITDDEFKYYQEFLSLSLFTVSNNIFKNIMLRIRFGIHIGRLNRDIKSVQDMMLTSPLIAEQYYWKKEFELHGEDLAPIEEIGFNAVMKQLRQNRRDAATTTRELHQVQKYYRERHRRIGMKSPDPIILYETFLSAFHQEFLFLQDQLTNKQLTVETASQLQKQIIYDELAYIKNSASYTATYR